jgi:cytochrome c oxidase subunit 1
VLGSSRLVLAHFWVAFAAFGAAILLGAWQMLVRSPLHRWVDPEQYYRAVTAHGTTLAYVFPTLIAMGFGYAVCAVSLGRPMHGTRLAWLGLWLVIAGAVIALATIAMGQATVLYTFYPPLTGSPWYYLGVLIAVVGSWIWIGLMVSHFARWKRDHPGLPVPLAMFATTAGALLWGMDIARRRRGDRLPDPAQCIRLDVHDRRRARPPAVLVDAARRSSTSG